MQQSKSDIRIKNNFKKNIVWIIILLGTLLMVTVYNSVLKANIKDFRLFDYFKHPDKIQSDVLAGDEGSIIRSLINKYSPFHGNEVNNEAITNDINKDVSEKLEEQIEVFKDNEEISENNYSGKTNIFIDFYKLSMYRHFLSDIQAILIDFSQDKPYEDSLDKVKFFINNLPEIDKDITRIISMLDQYNKQYLLTKTEYKESVIPEYKIIKKFIKIEKTSHMFKDKEELKSQIYKNLDNLRNIIYSNKTEQIFLNSSL